MNYHHMIEPYLYGSLSPEDEVAFERQMSRDPSLAEAAGERLNARASLAGFSGNHSYTRRSSAGSRMLLLLAGVAVVVLGLFYWKMRPAADRQGEEARQTDVPVIQSKVLRD